MSMSSLQRPTLPAIAVSHGAVGAREMLATKRTVSSQLLLAGVRELVIQHRDAEYHLRLTRNDKLILTK